MRLRKSENRPSQERSPAPVQKRKKWGRVLACLAAFAVLAIAARPGQQPEQRNPSSSPATQNTPVAIDRKLTPDQPGKDAGIEAANAQRRKEIAEDSAKLLKMAAELKAEVDKTTKDTLSLAVIKKAAEIEKLARSVKERMKLAAGTR